MKAYICGDCRAKGKELRTTRKGLREHLKKEHMIKHNLANSDSGQENSPLVKQSHWITEEI